MAKKLYEETSVQAIANAIRAKTGKTDTMTLAEMPDEIASIENAAPPITGYYEANSIDNEDGTQTLVITDGTSIADGIVIKARDTDGYPTEVDIYCSSGVFDNVVCGRATEGNRDTRFIKLEKINFKNSITQFKDQAFCGLSSLNTVTGVKSNPFEDVISLGNWNTFNYCALPGELSFPNLTSAGVYSFYCMPNITKISCPKLTYAHQYFAYNCASLKEIYLPSCTTVNGDDRYALGNNTALEKLEVGSVGHGVVGFKDIALHGCTQSFLTVIIYTTGSNADTMLANIRNSATNATIIIKASEDTEYNSTAFAADETILTSTVEVTDE